MHSRLWHSFQLLQLFDFVTFSTFGTFSKANATNETFNSKIRNQFQRSIINKCKFQYKIFYINNCSMAKNQLKSNYNLRLVFRLNSSKIIENLY